MSEQSANPAVNVAAVGRMLRPASIAIVGASPTPGALGASVLANLERNGYAGDIHLINPKRAEINGRACLASVDDLPEGVDVAILAIPQAAVLDTVRALARRKVGGAVIFSAGFAEGGEEGMAQQQEIARIAAEAGMVVEGPNCLGAINYLDRIPLTFIDTEISAEQAAFNRSHPSIAFLSQSGAMMAVVARTLADRALPMSFAVSTGNEAASHIEDYLDYALQDPATRVLAMFAEQFRQPQRLLAAAERARELGKTIVLLHPGKSSAARESAATHTGAMAGDYQVMRAKVERAGVVIAETLEELGDIAEIALRSKLLPKRSVAVVGESGAFKALSLDLCEEIGLELPKINDGDSPALRAAIPPFVALSNPLDLTAQGLVDPDLYRRTLVALLGDERFSAVVIGVIQRDAIEVKMPPIIQALRKQPQHKPVIVAGLDEGAAVPQKFIDELRELGCPYFPTTERVLRALRRLGGLSEREFGKVTANKAAPDLSAISGVVPEYRSKQVLAQIGVPFSAGRLAKNVEEATAIANEIGYPVVLKAQSADLSHKSDAGGVVLGLDSPESLAKGWDKLAANIAHHRPGLVLDGVLVEAMGKRGLELIVGARNDAQWGAVILVGFGGVTAEITHDAILLPPDLPPAAIIRELDKLKGAPLLHGYRGSPALDVEALAQVVSNLGLLVQQSPQIREIDLNPVVLHPRGEGVIALDALMLLD
ncbi:MAG: acetate--CoA ligase family protein [Pseudoxanthomonas sp.]